MEFLSPGAYLILIDEADPFLETLPEQLDSELLLPSARGIPTVPSSICGSAFCNITGVPLSDEDRSVVPILQDRIEETRLAIFFGQHERLPPDLDAPQNYLTMASSLRPHFDQYSFGIDVDDDYRIIQFSKPSPDFDVSNAGVLKIPESQAMPYDNCLRLHFLFCIRTYLASPPPGTQTYSMDDVRDLEDVLGAYNVHESLPDLSDPVWSSPLGQEVLRSVLA
ncbi:hypothetical protein BS47DRAFT_1394263 [Hydnum rufescens UP504]|uniref:HNH nuclease domain-containing protein n=1 Tax=Hydnum rufescens UP504 TaxID=1448309 RepID=A0A9P6DV76_9AGAM|nr:hypothetical protein BS47DRAFT_1394263 [Hydnum rufescens UP504]